MAYTTINKGSNYFNTVLWTGNGTSQSITGVGFQPDWIWIKRRNSAANHQVEDSVRGIGKHLHSNTADVEVADATTITSLDSDGYTLGSFASVNGSTNTFVGWNWLAGGTASSNTDGSITSTVSTNTTSGFSIVSYTGNGTAGATIGHGLGVVPDVVLVKGRSVGDSWTMQHRGIASDFETDMIKLDESGAFQDNSVFWNDTAPTSTVFSVDGVGGETKVNASGYTYISYCFTSIKGFSKFGSYVSNNNADGTFVYTGFKPAFLLLKNITTGNTSWEMYDNKRTPNNIANLFLRANTTEVDVSSDRLDILSNGFKLRQVGDTNANSDVIIYMAFAEHPFVSSTGTPTTAR